MLKPTFGRITKLITNSLIPSEDCCLNMRFKAPRDLDFPAYYNSNRVEESNNVTMSCSFKTKTVPSQEISMLDVTTHYLTVAVIGNYESCREVQLICMMYIREQRILALATELDNIKAQGRALIIS